MNRSSKAQRGFTLVELMVVVTIIGILAAIGIPRVFAYTPGHRNLGHLEDDVAAMAHDLGADLHEFLPQARQRPLLDRLRESQRPHEVGKIVGQRMKLKPDGVGGERAA